MPIHGADMMEVRLWTHSGCMMAVVWAIIPPSEVPTTWARSNPERIEQPDRIVGHVLKSIGR